MTSKDRKEASEVLDDSYDEEKGQRAMLESKREILFARMQFLTT